MADRSKKEEPLQPDVRIVKSLVILIEQKDLLLQLVLGRYTRPICLQLVNLLHSRRSPGTMR